MGDKGNNQDDKGNTKVFVDLEKIENLMNPAAFKTTVDLKSIPKFNNYGDNIEPIIRLVPIQMIDEYTFNPRKANNDHFEEIKESIRRVGLQQKFSLVKNPTTQRYTLIKGGNTRLRAFKELYRETADAKFASINCIIEPWDGELNKTQAIIAHLVENEARGELILVDKATALIELEWDFRRNLNNKKDSEDSSESFDQRKDNYKKTGVFVEYLKNNGYSVSEGQLGLFRFTATKLTGNLDQFLNQGMGSPQIIKIRSVYNNLKRIVKEHDIEDYTSDLLDADFARALKKYNKNKKTFEFEKLLNVLVDELVVQEPFIDIFSGNSGALKKEVLSVAKKTKPKKVEEQQQKQDTLNNNDDDDVDHGSGASQNNNSPVDHQEPKSNTDVDDDNDLSTEQEDGDNKPSVPTTLTTTTTKEVDVKPISHHTLQTQILTQAINEDLVALREQAADLAHNIARKLKIGSGIVKNIETGCGFLLIDLVEDSNSNDKFQSWGVWWLLLGYSHATDLLNPIAVATIEAAGIVNDDLFTLYSKTNLVDVELLEVAFQKINEFSEMYEFRSPNLQSVKNLLTPPIWQEVTELEAICYQIIRIVANTEEMTLWD